MSRSRTCRLLLSAAQRAAIERELRRSRLDTLGALVGGADHEGGSPAANVLGAATSIGEVRASLDAESDPLVALELVKAECRALARQASSAGIDRCKIDPLMKRIDELLVLADRVPLDRELAAIEDLYADAASFAACLVDAMNRVQTLRLAGVAATHVLGRMVFDITDELLLGDEVRVQASSQAGPRAQVTIDGHAPRIDDTIDDHVSLAHVLIFEEEQPRHRAVDMAVEFHTMMERELLDAGLAAGPLETITLKRPVARFWQIPRASGRGRGTGPGARAPH